MCCGFCLSCLTETLTIIHTSAPGYSPQKAAVFACPEPSALLQPPTWSLSQTGPPGSHSSSSLCCTYSLSCVCSIITFADSHLQRIQPEMQRLHPRPKVVSIYKRGKEVR